MNDEYEVIKEFKCHVEPMVTVRIGCVAHVISQEEWRKIYGRNHQDEWKKKLIVIDLCQERDIVNVKCLRFGGIM